MRDVMGVRLSSGARRERIERWLAAATIAVAIVAAAEWATAQQSETINGQPQQVVPEVGETGAPPAQNQVGSPVVTSGGAPPVSKPASGNGSTAGGAGTSGGTGGSGG
jgi:hypothetical protein